MLVPLMVAPAFGSELPDEINYSPYERQYNQLASQVDIITEDLNQTKADLNYQYNLESKLLNDIAKLKAENTSLEDQVQSNEQRRSDLEARVQDLQSQLNSLQTRINRTERQRNQVERRIISEERRLVPYQTKVDRLEKKLSQQNVLVSNADRALRQAEKLSSRLRSQLQTLQQERKSIKSALDAATSKLSNIDSQIAKKKSELSGLPAKITQVEKNLANAKKRQAKLTKELTDLQTELGNLMRTDRANPRVRELRGLVAAKAKEKREQDQKVSQVSKRLKTLKSSENNIKKAIAKLENEKKSLPAKIAKMEANLKTKKKLIQTKKVEVGNAETVTAERRRDLDQVAAEASRIQNRLRNANSDLVRESRTLNSLITDLNDLNNAVANLNRSYNNVSNDYNLTANEIDSINNRIPNLERQISQNVDKIDRLDRDLIVTENKIVSLNNAITNLEADQSDAITKRDLKYSEYISRLDYYNEKLAEAKSLGASQSDSALSIAVRDSNAYVDSRSSELADLMGEKLGNAQSSLWSAVRAEIKGYEEGYNSGYASTPDQARGESEGRLAGIAEAKDYANQVLKPQFFNQIFANRIGKNRIEFTPSLESFDAAISAVETQLELVDILSTISPITAEEMNESLNTNTNLDSVITGLNSALSTTLKEKVSLSKPANAYQTPSNIPVGVANCSSVYKGLSVFQKACKNEYLDTFETKYTSEYFANFEAQYSNLYETKLAPIKDDVLEATYQSNMDKYYPVAFNSGEAVGKAEIYRQSYEAAKAAAYSSELPSATASAELTAKNEVDSYIRSNATLTIKEAKLGNSDLRGGSRIQLQLALKNISPKSLVSPVKLDITTANNITLPATKFYVKSAQGNKVTLYTDVVGKINDNVRSNTRLTLAGKITLPGGKYQSQRVETFSASAVTALNPAVSAQYKYFDKPQVLTRFRRRTIIQNFDITLTPAVESLKAGYSINLSAAPGYESMINFKNTSVRTNRLSYGQSANARFQYTFPRSSRGKTVVMLLKYTYQGKVIKTEKITLKPF